MNDEEIQMSSESDPQEIDMDLINDIKVDEKDIEELDQLLATTKHRIQQPKPDQSYKQKQQLDLFLRNFFIRNKMPQTLNNFQQEWYEMVQTGKIIQGANVMPQEYVKSEALRDELKRLKDDLDKAIIVAEKARGTYDKLFKERNFHRMHHQRVQQEKKKLNADLEKLRNNHLTFEGKYEEMADKYSHLMKEKMLIKLERDRLKTRAQIQKEMQQGYASSVGSQENIEQNKTANKTSEKVKFTPFPPDERPNPYSEQEIFPNEYKNCVLYKTWRPHNMAVTAIALHPKRPILATVSDDLSWKIMTTPQGELVMSGEGHKEWLSGIKFHPRGMHVVTCSGDSTIKLWDFVNATCSATFKDHTQPIWDIDFHDMGDFFASASMDHLAKIYDLNVNKCRHSLRGHVDSVNTVNFQPYSNILATGSADKTISLWDLRTSLCVQTFYGHNNSVNSVHFNLTGDKIAACDSDGILKVWDVRMVKEKISFDCGPYPANAAHFDKSGTLIAIGLDNGEIKVYNEQFDKTDNILKGHEGAVLDVAFDYKSKAIYSSGNDCTVRIWQ